MRKGFLFYFNSESHLGLGKESSVSVFREMLKPHWKVRLWVLGLCPVCSQREGKRAPRTLFDSWFFSFISGAWPHFRFCSFTSLCSP